MYRVTAYDNQQQRRRVLGTVPEEYWARKWADGINANNAEVARLVNAGTIRQRPGARYTDARIETDS